MNIGLLLGFFRQFKGLEPEGISAELGISVEEYKNLENGKKKINGIIAQKLSEYYVVPFEIFIINDTPQHFYAEVIYNNCSFSGITNGYVKDQFIEGENDRKLRAKEEEIKHLKFEIDGLQQQNRKLVESLSEKMDGVLYKY